MVICQIENSVRVRGTQLQYYAESHTVFLLFFFEQAESPAVGIDGLTLERLRELGKKQLAMEIEGSLTVQSVEVKEDVQNVSHFVSAT
jgi:hypothetical protein